MAKDSIYVIGPASVHGPRKKENDDDTYVKRLVAAGRIPAFVDENGDAIPDKRRFKNRGAVRISNDGTKVLLEEKEEMFLPADLAKAEFIGNEEEIRLYLKAHSDEWERPDIE